jgi:hypothetical protein
MDYFENEFFENNNSQNECIFNNEFFINNDIEGGAVKDRCKIVNTTKIPTINCPKIKEINNPTKPIEEEDFFETVGGNDWTKPKYTTLDDVANEYKFDKDLDIKKNNVIVDGIPYESSISGGDFYDDPSANQNQSIETSRLEEEIKQNNRIAASIKPIVHALNNPSDCADLSKKPGESCLPPDVLGGVLKTHNATTLDDVKRKTSCDSEKCVAERTNSQLGVFFKQSGPTSTTKWLSNSNIDTLLASFAAHRPKFLHIPFHMINFAEKSFAKLNYINWKEASRNYDSAACAINTDTYERMKGKHWFAIYVSFKDKTIEYFDSAARDRPEINNWIEKTNAALGNTYTVKKNTIQHQKGSTECGVYTIYFIACRLLFNIPFEEFQKIMINDEYMHVVRKLIFV